MYLSCNLTLHSRHHNHFFKLFYFPCPPHYNGCIIFHQVGNYNLLNLDVQHRKNNCFPYPLWQWHHKKHLFYACTRKIQPLSLLGLFPNERVLNKSRSGITGRKGTTILFFFLATPHGTWDLSSPTRDRTHTPVMEARSLNYWTSREVQGTAVLRLMI